jgi:hypothetical protein
MAAQPEFAEAAVDRALVKYLGWWKAGFYRPDFDVPAVRDALVKKFVADGFDLRKLEREIVTSLLYTQAAARTPSQLPTVPIWAFGPTKLLYAEAWLDSVGRALARPAGGCDFRYDYGNAKVIPGVFNFALAPRVSANFYFTAAQNMGGCPAASTHGDPSGLVPAVERRVALAQLCPGALEAKPGATAFDLVTQAFGGVGRPPSDFESSTLLRYMASSGQSGQPLMDALCTSLFASSSFSYY